MPKKIKIDNAKNLSLKKTKAPSIPQKITEENLKKIPSTKQFIRKYKLKVTFNPNIPCHPNIEINAQVNNIQESEIIKKIFYARYNLELDDRENKDAKMAAIQKIGKGGFDRRRELARQILGLDKAH